MKNSALGVLCAFIFGILSFSLTGCDSGCGGDCNGDEGYSSNHAPTALGFVTASEPIGLGQTTSVVDLVRAARAVDADGDRLSIVEDKRLCTENGVWQRTGMDAGTFTSPTQVSGMFSAWTCELTFTDGRGGFAKTILTVNLRR